MLTRRTFLRALLGSAAGAALAPIVEPGERVRRFWQVPRSAPVNARAPFAGAEAEGRSFRFAEPVRLIGEHGATLRSGRAFELQLGNEPPRTLAGRLHAIDEMRALGLVEDGGDLRALLERPGPLSADEARRTLANADALFGIDAGSYPRWREVNFSDVPSLKEALDRIARPGHRWGRYDAELGEVVYGDPSDNG
ncbi:MAG TPA: hypothetical protein VHM19_23255 [Polyangiales bacterium]|jgi:hypothetical protein|nr:hypothetical protein [Polyangiales bacterium]